MVPAKKKESTEKDRQRFANFMRATRNRNVLTRIAAAYDWASDEVSRGLILKSENKALHNALRRHQLEGYVIGGTPITYSQAAIIYEMVHGKYGGLDRKSSQAPVTESKFLSTRPEGYIPEIQRLSEEECFEDQDRRVMAS